MDEIGRNARRVSKLIDDLRLKGKLYENVPLPNGGSLRIELNHRSFSSFRKFIGKTSDNRILAVAKNLSLEEETKEGGRPVILVSKDMLIRVKADAIGLMSEDFSHDRVVDNDDIYSGYTDVYIRSDQMNSFFEHHYLQLDEISEAPLCPNSLSS